MKLSQMVYVLGEFTLASPEEAARILLALQEVRVRRVKSQELLAEGNVAEAVVYDVSAQKMVRAAVEAAMAIENS